MEYVEAIREDIQWLGFQWETNIMHPTTSSNWGFRRQSDMKEGKAYIDEQNSEQIAAQKALPPNRNRSPYRNRPIEESLNCSTKMNSGEIEEGKMVPVPK